MAKQAPKMDVSSTGTGKLKYIDGGAVESAQGAPARTGHWLAALLRRRFVKALIVANLVAFDAAIAAGNRLAAKPRAFGV